MSDNHNEYLDELIRYGLLNRAEKLSQSFITEVNDKKHRCAAGIIGDLAVGSQVFNICLIVDELFPYSFPQIFVAPTDGGNDNPHVFGDMILCYTHTEDTVPNFNRPVDILVESVEKARRTLLDGIQGINQGDWLNEFSVHWAADEYLASFISPDNTARLVYAAENNRTYQFVTDTIAGVQEYFNSVPPSKHTHRHAIYIPLDGPVSALAIRQLCQSPTAANFKSLVLAYCLTDNLAALKSLANKHSNVDLLIISFPNPLGDRTLFGIRIDDPCNKLLFGEPSAEIHPVKVWRLDLGYIAPRGGSNLALRNKKVAIAGIGSVGGYLAFEIARAGVLDLTLIDPDRLNEENIFRHVLGRQGLGKRKSDAVKNEIEAKLPYVRVTPIVDRVEHMLDSGELPLSDLDLFIVAIGNPTTELLINKIIHSTKNAPSIVFAWVEAYGIGGHALLANNPRNQKNGGCMQCLYTSVSSDERFADRSAFAASDQNFLKQLAGCASAFIPYSSLDAMRTAEVACRLAISCLLGDEDNSPLISWKGDSARFLANGYRLSDRYSLTDEQLFERRYQYHNPACQICGGDSYQ